MSIKTTLFILLLFLLVGGGLCYRNKGFSLGGSKIAPYSEWAKILPGKWTYFQEEKDASNEKRTMEGEVDYTAEGKFKRYVTFTKYIPKYFAGRVDGYNYYTSGGSLAGTWQVNNDSSWSENKASCSMPVYQNLDLCSSWGKVSIYGNYKDDDLIFKIKKFNQDEILIEGRIFSTGTTYTYKAQKTTE